MAPDPRAFSRALEAWHEYYLLAGTAAVTMMGLLFVSLSIHIERVAHESGRHLEATAREAFSSFLIVLSISLMMLIPNGARRPMAFSLFGVGLFRGIQTAWRMRVSLGPAAAEGRGALRTVLVRSVFPLIGSAFMVLAGFSFLRWEIEMGLALVMTACVFLIADASRSAYELLVRTARRT